MKKILLIRFSSIGDMVLTTPVIRALKTQLDAEIHAVTKKRYAFLYENNPNISKVYSLLKSEKEIIGALQKEHYDFVVDLQKNLRSRNITRSLKVESASFPKMNIKKWLLVNFKADLLPKVHVVDRYFKAVEKLKVKKDNLGLEYFIPANDEVKPEAISKELTNGFVGFVIGGQHYTKIFPAEKVAEVINKLSLPVLLLGGKEDFDRGEEIVNLTPNRLVINTCGKYNLNQSASLVKQCMVLITNDTGLMHIGAAFNKPIVSVWGNTVPEFGMVPYMPNNKSGFFIAEVNGLSCRPCSKLGHSKCPKKHFKCMMMQDVEGIAGKVEEFVRAVRITRNKIKETR